VSIPLAIAICAGAAATAVALLLVLRWLAPRDGFWGDREPNHSAAAAGVLGSGFAILVAFVLSLAFTGFQAAAHGAEQEAQATQALYRDAAPLPAAARAALRASATCYARAVAFTDWGTDREVAQRWPASLALVERRADPGDAAQVRALDRLDSDDRDRASGYLVREEHAARSVPSILWLAMIGGGVLLIGYLCAFARPTTRLALQVYLVASVATVGALNLCVISFLDAPFAGASPAVRPTAMRYALQEMGHARASAPCDARGRPLQRSPSAP
jgi:hypothetical protein